MSESKSSNEPGGRGNESERENERENERYERGWENLAKIHPEAGPALLDALREVAPDLGRYVVEFPYGDVYAREGLSLKEREMVTVASLITQGHPQTQLKNHIRAALNVGCTRGEIVEIIIQMAVYAGFPAALTAAMIAKEVFADLDRQEPKGA
jgi:4-carboxymuconolactone decarboxylase